jgi:hypothetical protein
MERKMQTRDILPPQGYPFNQSMTYPYPLEYVDRPYEVPEWCLNGGDPDMHNPFPQEGTGVITTFDNTPRRLFKSATLYNSDEPEKVLVKFERNLYAALYYQKCCQRSNSTTRKTTHRMDDRFVAVNAWNEWAEGMSIEPSDVYGRSWLKVIDKVQRQVKRTDCPFPSKIM